MRNWAVEDPLITDASVLILLARIARLDLLKALAARVIAPLSVLAEVEAGALKDPAAASVHALPWLEAADDLAIPAEIHAWSLGRGESQVLAHGLANPGAGCVLDDRAARRCAADLGLPTVGTLGLVLTAKQEGFLPAARPTVIRLRESGLYLTDATVEAALAEVGE